MAWRLNPQVMRENLELGTGGQTFHFVNEGLESALASVFFGGGRRLIDKLREPLPQFRIDQILDRPAAKHLCCVRR